MIPNSIIFIAQLRRLAVVLALAFGLVWLAVPRAHAGCFMAFCDGSPSHRLESRHVTRSPRLVAVALRYLGHGNFTHFHGPWCAAAEGRWLALAGYHRLKSLRAIDYRHYGRPSRPAPGAIAVLRHHVGIVVRMTPRGPLLISGNHRHRVGLGVYSARRILAYRRPV